MTRQTGNQSHAMEYPYQKGAKRGCFNWKRPIARALRPINWSDYKRDSGAFCLIIVFTSRSCGNASETLAIEQLADLARLPFTTKRELVSDQEEHPFGTNLTYPLSEY